MVQPNGDRRGAGDAGGGGTIGPGGRQIDDFIAGPGSSLQSQLNRLHAPAGPEELVLGELPIEMPRVIACQRQAQIGKSTLPGVESLSRAERPIGGLCNEGRRGQVPLPDPERNKSWPPATVVGDSHDTAFRRMAGMR